MNDTKNLSNMNVDLLHDYIFNAEYGKVIKHFESIELDLTAQREIYEKWKKHDETLFEKKLKYSKEDVQEFTKDIDSLVKYLMDLIDKYYINNHK